MNEVAMNCNLIPSNDHQKACLTIDKRIAYHQSGHAVAICLGNKQKQLPDVYFKILLNRPYQDANPSLSYARRPGDYTEEFEGGRLIHSLPFSFSEATRVMPKQEQEEYKLAFEADIINLLVGPLAEAKYVASLDDESFSPNLVNFSALRFYGGNQELGLVTEYMDCFKLKKLDYERKLNELYLAAYRFINNQANWRAITSLAELFLEETASFLNCEEVISLLEPYLASKSTMKVFSWPNNSIENPNLIRANQLSVSPGMMATGFTIQS
jgi:hypothetical protein